MLGGSSWNSCTEVIMLLLSLAIIRCLPLTGFRDRLHQQRHGALALYQEQAL